MDKEETLQKIKSASDELDRVCKNNFSMKIHIPVMPEDSDVIISDGLEAAEKFIKEQ